MSIAARSFSKKEKKLFSVFGTVLKSGRLGARRECPASISLGVAQAELGSIPWGLKLYLKKNIFITLTELDCISK